MSDVTSHQLAAIGRAVALADAGDAGRAALDALLGCGTTDPAMVYAAGFGAARVLLRDLLAIITDLDTDGVPHAGSIEDVDDGTEPYCAGCGAFIGMFAGIDGWRHFRGDPAAGGDRTLYDVAHEADPAWSVPAGRSLAPCDIATIREALADAISSPTVRGTEGGTGDAAQAGKYEALLRRLVTGTDQR